jgi:histidinol phosphatase-like PHP family hydrolase
MNPANQATAISRRGFLAAAMTAAAVSAPSSRLIGAEPSATAKPDFPLVDFHVHLDNSTIEQVVELARSQGVKYGIVEHAGTEENKYPVVLSNDEEMNGYLKMLDGKPVYRGVQAEWTDWTSGFSRKMLGRLDFILMDAMTYPGKDGQRVKLWDPDAAARVDMSDKQKFMDRFVEWHVELLEQQPIDVFANVSWLPAPLADEYDTYWTPPRIQKVVRAAAGKDVAIEIGLKIPSLAFLKIAKEAGVKFTLGTNGRYPNMGKLAPCIEMAGKLGLKSDDMFTPKPEGQRAVDRWKGKA